MGNSRSLVNISISAMQKDRNKCFYCGRAFNDSDRLPSRDHIVPVSKGGGNISKNILLVCMLCNKIKADYSLEEFRDKASKVWPTGDKSGLFFTLLNINTTILYRNRVGVGLLKLKRKNKPINTAWHGD